MRNEADSGWRIADRRSRGGRVLNVLCSATGKQGPVFGQHIPHGRPDAVFGFVLSAIRYPLSASLL
jgi:hypothetical protein